MRTASLSITRVFGAAIVSASIGLGVTWAAPAPQMTPQQRVDAAYKAIAAAFPDRRTIQLDASDLVYGGGGIHCITQQQPAVSAPDSGTA